MSLVVERDEQGRWIVTIAGVSRSRRDSIEAALAEAAGTLTATEWVGSLAETLAPRPETGHEPRPALSDCE